MTPTMTVRRPVPPTDSHSDSTVGWDSFRSSLVTRRLSAVMMAIVQMCKCAVTPPPTFVNLVIIGSLVTHQILAKLVNRILRYGGGGGVLHVRTCRDALPHP